MSVYDPFKDTPKKIISEGQQISITFEKISASSANICWTLPVNAEITNAPPSEYNGIVIVLDTVPIIGNQTPIDGKYYVADQTADADLHVGDKIGTGLVIGAFYDDKITTSFTIQGVNPNTPYYVAGFAVDNVARYHTAGVHSYSLDLKLNDLGTDTSGYNIVTLGVQGTDLTGLIPSKTYTLLFAIDGISYTWTFEGSSTPTYQDFIDGLNFKIATIDNPFIGGTPQNSNGLYVNATAKLLYEWDGFQNNLLPAYFGDPAPNDIAPGVYWSDADHALYQWDGSQWNTITTFNFIRSLDQLECQDYWYDGSSSIYRWDNTIWIPQTAYIQNTDPTAVPVMDCNTYWLDENTDKLYYWLSLVDCGDINKTGKWIEKTAINSSVNPHTLIDGSYWFNSAYHLLNIRVAGAWHTFSTPKELTDPPVYIQNTEPLAPALNSLWYNETTNELQVYNGTWSAVESISWPTDPTTIVIGSLWLDTSNNILYVWDGITSAWVTASNFISSTIDPSLPSVIATNSVWLNPLTEIMQTWDGTQWVLVAYFISSNTPTLVSGDYWYNTATNLYYQFDGTNWILISTQYSVNDPLTPTLGDYWYSLSSTTLSLWTGLTWMPVLFSNTPLTPNVDTLWYNSLTYTLSKWNGTNWVAISPKAIASLDTNGDFILTSTTKGSVSVAYIAPYEDAVGSIPGVFTYTTPRGVIQPPIKGTDSVPEIPMYNQIGVGTDGSEDERRNLISQLLMSLGYPSVKIELTKDQLNYAIDQALLTFRRNSSSAYERAIFFMDFMPGQQGYYLTDKSAGMNRITHVQAIYRRTSSFLGTAAGQGVYGQMVLQHLYQMGTYDLVSYAIISEYVELMEILFATRVVFRFHERSRRLDILQNVGMPERVLVDCTLERTEQELMTDRITGKWVKDWALGEACQMLAQTRGKFSALPGASGSVSLNASDLQAKADALFERCYADIDDFIASEPEIIGLESTIMIG